jgi:uncharacterized alpha-E superfamily protein
MLSRSAERVYWAGRYLERAENTARIVQQYSQMLLDLPDEVGVDWPELLPVFGVSARTVADGQLLTEQQFMHLILADKDGPASLFYSLRMARENIRNNRDLLPMESWESINELYQLVRESLDSASTSEDRFEFLADCIAHCQQVFGCLHGTMSHHSPYHFLTLGQHIERADMTSRVIDIAASYFTRNERLTQRYGSTLWTNVLKTVGGFQMYRQYVQPQVSGNRVIDFLVNDAAFPRAIHCCVANAMQSAEALPRNAETIKQLQILADTLSASRIDDLDAVMVSQLMDELQKYLGRVHQAVARTWFLAGPAG